MSFVIQQDKFEGPLDLLLHLVSAHEIDIFDINIFMIADEYLNYLRCLYFEDLAAAGAFVQMAASLIEFKSRSLLPPSKQKTHEEDHDVLTEEDLKQQLSTYKLFKQVAEYLNTQSLLYDSVGKSQEHIRLEKKHETSILPLIGDPYILVMSYEDLLKNLSNKKPLQIEEKAHLITLQEIMRYIRERINQETAIAFFGFFEKNALYYDVIIHFLAILELTKNGVCKLYQNNFFSTLWVLNKKVHPSYLPLLREGRENSNIN